MPSKKLSAANAEDIVKVLIRKDSAGKRKQRVWQLGTVDSYKRKLRSIFNKLGRTGMFNPLSYPTVKEYLKFVREVQAQQPF